MNVVSTPLVALGLLLKLTAMATEHDIQTDLCVVGSVIHCFKLDKLLEVTGGAERLKYRGNVIPLPWCPLSKLVSHQYVNRLRAQVPGCSERCGSRVVRDRVGAANEAVAASLRYVFLIGRMGVQWSGTLVHGVGAKPETHERYVSECRDKDQMGFVRSEGKNTAKALKGDAGENWKDRR